MSPLDYLIECIIKSLPEHTVGKPVLVAESAFLVRWSWDLVVFIHGNMYIYVYIMRRIRRL